MLLTNVCMDPEWGGDKILYGYMELIHCPCKVCIKIDEVS